MNYDTLPAGREMDALVAEKVMGWTYVSPRTWCGYKDGVAIGGHDTVPPTWPARLGAVPIPDYSTSIAAAWQVVEKMDKVLWPEVGRMADSGWYCEIVRGANVPSGVQAFVREVASTAPLAICRAALKATDSK